MLMLAFNSEYNNGGVGVLIRDSKGSCISEACQNVDHVQEPAWLKLTL
jgi:hypothetical protein